MGNTKIKTQDICRKELGDFKEFKGHFFSLKFGRLPTEFHPDPNGIANMKKMEDWPEKPTHLNRFLPMCAYCQTFELFTGCQFSLKAMVGECDGLYHEMLKIRHDLRDK